MTGVFLWINIPLMVLFFGLWVGIPMWMIFKRPDRHPRESRTIPAYLRQPAAVAVPAPKPRGATGRVRIERRELVSAGRS